MSGVRFLVGTGLTVALVVGPLAVPLANADPPGTSSPPDPVSAVADMFSGQTGGAVTAKKSHKNTRLQVKVNKHAIVQGSAVTLTVKRTPKGKKKIAFQVKQLAQKWATFAHRKTSKKGKVTRGYTAKQSGEFHFRVKALQPNVTSKSLAVKVTKKPTPIPPSPTPTPTPTPIPGPTPTGVSAVWPTSTALQVDADYAIAVQVEPAGKMGVNLQTSTASGWQDLAGGSGETNAAGTTKLDLNVASPGPAEFRVVTSATPSVTTAPFDASFTDGGDAIYNVPAQLPSQPGVLVKAQEYPMTYPKLAIKNPLNPSENLIVPKIGDPAVGPPKCVTDPAIAREDCQIPGKQYRIMYSDERWVPNASGGGAVKPGTEAATALLMVPPNVAPNAPVVAWAHPTIGQSNPCSITRGTAALPNGAGPGGMDINIMDMIFFLDDMLAKGYIVVMPDYLGIAVNGPTSLQKTYVVGPQEARDLFYAVKALQTAAKPAVNWPGLPQAGRSFVTMGHSQGGHAALWAGVESPELEETTGLSLEGVIAVAPATDLNMLVNAQAEQQVNWTLGPEVIQTWAGYLPQFALANNVLSEAGMNNLGRFMEYCTTQAFVASNEFFPNGPGQPGTAFMKDPQAPQSQAAFFNWSKIFGAQIPTIQQGLPNSFPKKLPLLLVSGNADNVVLSQANAAFQQSFCAGGANMSAAWTPVATGVVNSPTATTPSAQQAANHLNVLAFPFANDVDPGKGKQAQLVAGSLVEFTGDRFRGKTLNPDCAAVQKPHSATAPVGKVDSWYVFPRLTWKGLTPTADPSDPKFYETGGDPALMLPSKGGDAINLSPALGTVNLKSVSQTGCGFQFMKKPGIKIGYDTNAECTQWGMYPYGQFLYPSAGVGKGWGNYPFQPAQVSVASVSQKSKIHVDVNPNRRNKNYTVKVQKSAASGWKSVKQASTVGVQDTVGVNVGKGRYRVVVPQQHGHRRIASKAVTVVK